MTLLDGLVSHWKFDEESGTRVDSHGTNDLMENGAQDFCLPEDAGSPTAVGFAAGKLGNAALFDQQDQNLYAHDFETADAFTLAMWLKISISADVQALACLELPDGQTAMSVIFSSDAPDFVQMSVAGQTENATVKYEFPVDEWFLLTGWYDAAEGKVHAHVNNSDAGLIAETGTNLDPRSATGMWLGHFFSGASTPYALDSVSFWSRVLTSDERTAYWNNGAGLDYPFTPPVTRGTGSRNYYWQRYDREGQIQNERKLIAEMEAARRAVWQKGKK